MRVPTASLEPDPTSRQGSLLRSVNSRKAYLVPLDREMCGRATLSAESQTSRSKPRSRRIALVNLTAKTVFAASDPARSPDNLQVGNFVTSQARQERILTSAAEQATPGLAQIDLCNRTP